MKIKFLKLKNWLLLTLMGALGVGACHSAKDVAQTPEPEPETQPRPRSEMALMYGVPTVDYVVKGKVLKADGKPVKGLQVVLVNNNIDLTADTIYGNDEYVERYLQKSSDTTAADGTFEVKSSDMPSGKQRILVRDVDGKRHGNIQNELIDVEFDMDNVGGQRSGWRLGTAEKEMTITVKEKE
ncbi:MAG: radical SAM-associated putative lipoprotein [Bacteroidales bacterium]|nr:radical SAM-associated putative lipoprotein [Candidatus Colimorpha pelethequi]MCQ2262335.1 radical SAM-associated putative lipoprotein [Bacteroidales bacterium]